MDLLIQNVRLESKFRDVLIQDGKFAQIAPRIAIDALARSPQVLDGAGQAILHVFRPGSHPCATCKPRLHQQPHNPLRPRP